jgi:hypothetical protein
MPHRAASLVLAFLLSTTAPARAQDAREPDPLSVVRAAMAAQNVGNVDAATAFYTEDAVIVNSRGRQQQSIRGYHESNRRANVQFGTPGPDTRVEGNKVISPVQTRMPFLEQVGLGDPMDVGSVYMVEGSRIRRVVNYFELRSLDRIDRACLDHPEAVFFGQPCSEFAKLARAHTTRLIAEGVLAPE